MQKFLRLALVLIALAAPALAQTNIGYVDVVAERNTVPVRVSANSAELNQLALQAFGAHGRYRVTTSGHAYDIKFSLVTPTQVRVDVTRGSGATPVASEVATGANAREALLRAADIAVERTNGLGLKGFFTARLAFIVERSGKKEVCVSDLFFRDPKQLTHDNAHALMPRWSPDGNKLLYTTYFKAGFPDIYQIDLRTNQRTNFVSFKGTNSGARYSPNGQQVAMILSGAGNAEVYVGDAQGRQIRRLTHTDGVEASPCFSPDGSRLVFTSDSAGGPQLYVMPVAGRPIQRVPTNISGYCAEPDWNRADPNRIAFTIRIGRGYQIAVYDFSKRASVQASKAPFDGIEPCWLADGRHLVYTARDRSTSRICILDTVTGRSVPVSPAAFGSVMQANVLLR